MLTIELLSIFPVFILASYVDRYKTPPDPPIRNKKPRSFQVAGYCQPVHISLLYGYTGWNFVNCVCYLVVPVSPSPTEIQCANKIYHSVVCRKLLIPPSDEKITLRNMYLTNRYHWSGLIGRTEDKYLQPSMLWQTLQSMSSKLPITPPPEKARYKRWTFHPEINDLLRRPSPNLLYSSNIQGSAPDEPITINTMSSAAV